LDFYSNTTPQITFSTKRSIIMQSKMFGASKLALLVAITMQFSGIMGLPAVLEQRTPPIVMGLAKTFGAIAHTTLTSTGATV
jgi:hypothetical protein